MVYIYKDRETNFGSIRMKNEILQSSPSDAVKMELKKSLQLKDAKRMAYYFLALKDGKPPVKSYEEFKKSMGFNDWAMRNKEVIANAEREISKSAVDEGHGDLHYWGHQPKGPNYTVSSKPDDATVALKETIMRLVCEVMSEDHEQNHGYDEKTEINLIKSIASIARTAKMRKTPVMTDIEEIDKLAETLLKMHNELQENTEDDGGKNKNFLMQIQSASHWLKKNLQHANIMDSMKAVELIVNRVDSLLGVNEETSWEKQKREHDDVVKNAIKTGKCVKCGKQINPGISTTLCPSCHEGSLSDAEKASGVE